MNNYEGYWDGLLRRDKETRDKLKPNSKSMKSNTSMNEPSRNLTLVAETLDIANEHGMAAEVMWSALTMAAEANAHGKSMEEVLNEALTEWDI